MKAPACSGIWQKCPPEIKKICARFAKDLNDNIKAKKVRFRNFFTPKRRKDNISNLTLAEFWYLFLSLAKERELAQYAVAGGRFQFRVISDSDGKCGPLKNYYFCYGDT